MIQLLDRTGDVLLAMARDYERICKIVETDLTVEQADAIQALRDECRSAEKERARAK